MCRMQLGGASFALATDGPTTWAGSAGGTWSFTEPRLLPYGIHRGAAGGTLTSPMPGQVVTIQVDVGEEVVEGQRLLTLEAMKVEHAITAPFDGSVVEFPAAAGTQVAMGAKFVMVEPHVTAEVG